MSGDSSEPAGRMRDRGRGLRYRLFVELPRPPLVGLLAVTLWLGLVACGLAASPDAGLAGDPVETAFQALLGATITGVTLVVTLNQLVLSQELGAVGDQRDRMAGAVEFRDEVAAVVGRVPPAEPSAFLRLLVETARENADRLADATDDDPDAPTVDGEPLPAAVRTLTDRVRERADAVTPDLADGSFGSFAVVAAALDFEYSWKLHRARQVAAHDDALTEPQRAALEDLVETLTLFGPAREHVKTLYFQWELIALSRAVLAAALPALVAAAAAVLFYTPRLFGGRVVRVAAVSAWVVAATLPFLVLVAYVLRIATVTRRTLSIGPFVLRDRGE